MSEPRHKKPCPICGKPAEYETRPFCSKRCKDVDLHRWLGGQYAVPVVEEDGADAERRQGAASSDDGGGER